MQFTKITLKVDICSLKNFCYINSQVTQDEIVKSITLLILSLISIGFGFQDIAAFIKKEFDKKYNPTWHCIVGRNFGSYVTHETRHFIYFYLGQVAILLFKSG